MFKAQCKSCKYQLSKLQILRAKVANSKRRGKDRLLFNPKYLQDEDKNQRRECKDKEIRSKRYWEIWDLGNLLPKLSQNPKIKSQDAASRRKRPDGRTRRGHAPKRAANRRHMAAKTRPKPRFRGNIILSGDQFSWESCVGTLPPSAPINTPADATERVSSEIQS